MREEEAVFFYEYQLAWDKDRRDLGDNFSKDDFVTSWSFFSHSSEQVVQLTFASDTVKNNLMVLNSGRLLAGPCYQKSMFRKPYP